MHCGNPTKGIEHERAEGPFILTTTAVNIYQESVLFPWKWKEEVQVSEVIPGSRRV